ncbi:hypothetical protein A2U01_0109840, partial [Trifolium medium]|nr:hypothetical protein [Trifolium medium]
MGLRTKLDDHLNEIGNLEMDYKIRKCYRFSLFGFIG